MRNVKKSSKKKKKTQQQLDERRENTDLLTYDPITHSKERFQIMSLKGL